MLAELFASGPWADQRPRTRDGFNESFRQPIIQSDLIARDASDTHPHTPTHIYEFSLFQATCLARPSALIHPALCCDLLYSSDSAFFILFFIFFAALSFLSVFVCEEEESGRE